MVTAPADISAHGYLFDHQGAHRLCREKGLTYTELALRTGRGYHSVSAYVNGRQDPPAGVVCGLAAAFGIHPGDLFRPVTKEDASDGLIETRATTTVRATSRRSRLRLRRPDT
jgi:transcriptional regulator with XRE-family HTH domain